MNKVLENARAGKLIGSSLEAKVYLRTSDGVVTSRLQELCMSGNEADALHRIFITSQVTDFFRMPFVSTTLLLYTSSWLQVEVLSSPNTELVTSIPYAGNYTDQRSGEIWIGVSRAEGMKCERCWNYEPQVGSFAGHPTLCARCYDVINVQPLPAAAGVS